MQVVRIAELPDSFAALQATAKAEGYDFLDRLGARWRGNAYLDDRDASLFGIFDAGQLVAIGAQTFDEYEPSPDRRRLRHVYVDPSHRRTGVGRTLAGALIQQALALAPILALRATHDVSRAFWEAMGFTRIDLPTRSHEMRRA